MPHASHCFFEPPPSYMNNTPPLVKDACAVRVRVCWSGSGTREPHVSETRAFTIRGTHQPSQDKCPWFFQVLMASCFSRPRELTPVLSSNRLMLPPPECVLSRRWSRKNATASSRKAPGERNGPRAFPPSCTEVTKEGAGMCSTAGM